jgi:hypothetical protein
MVMHINSINSFIPNITQSSAQRVALSTDAQTGVIQDKKSGSSWDIHHMSLNELNEMIVELDDKGIFSAQEIIDLSGQQFDLAFLGEYPKDEKLDMISVFQEQIENRTANREYQAAANTQHALELLQGLDARSKANIPQYV